MHIDLAQIHSDGREESSSKVKFEESKGEIDYAAEGSQQVSAYQSTDKRPHVRIKQAQSTQNDTERNKDREKPN